MAKIFSQQIVPCTRRCVHYGVVYRLQFYSRYSYVLFLSIGSYSFDTLGKDKLIDDLTISSSLGIDKINSIFFFLNIKMYSVNVLNKPFFQCHKLGLIPDDRKVQRGMPLHKSGDKQCPSNCIYISRTSIPCKILGCHILVPCPFLRLKLILESVETWVPETVFIETKLLCFTRDLHFILYCGSQVDGIFLNFSKAFEKVPH